MLNSTSPAVLAFVAAATAAYAVYWERMGFTYAKAPRVMAIEKQKFILLQVQEERGGEYVPGSAYGFIAKEDGETKGLGAVKAGDILKAATFKAPAKGARGNVFSADNGAEAMSAGGSGIRYL
jgi:hypothetical protein